VTESSRWWLVALLLSSPALLGTEEGKQVGDFVIRDARVDVSDIVAGGPGKDGIRSVDAPRYAAPAEAGWAGPDTEVLGVALGGEAHAFPVRMLEFHQIVNDSLGGVPVAVTYDPLTGTPLVFDRRVEGRTLTFGVSGLLYNSNFLLFDRETESLWSQFLGRAVAGPLASRVLTRIPVRQETTRAWLERHPDSGILRHPKPLHIEYRVSPYQTYWVDEKIVSPVSARDSRYHAKELTLGVEVDGVARAYLGSIVTREGGAVDEEFRGKRIRIAYDSETGTFSWDLPEGVELVESYWFAWKAFHPDTEIWRDELPES
jgi:hypothetical protein